MKRKAFILLASAFALMTLNSVAQENRAVSGFSKIESGGPFNVHVKINGTESLKLDVDADVLKDIRTEVVGGVLKIDFKNHFSWNRNIKKTDIYITAKSLNGLANSGSGSVDLDGVLTGNDVDVRLSGSGNMDVAVKSNSLDAKVSGSGSINIKGSADVANLRISGSGNISGKSLRTQTTNAGITGSGGVDVIAEKSISGHITGSGGINYSGNAVIAEARYTGSGRINKED
ncbi:head GIN domain-containing protein [Mucilaginibacter flavus]|uniref:head GIN domain-containing protein n=1 Tax=Mucilaginibacter flavus TaxID=931504 RepID=UPI0025B61173|nr:head GIN domain-containing protein [Mucilaginibacter flavus]MDN3584309.1 head GIN domain-containing protein [Mucilaginibacter flavus]